MRLFHLKKFSTILWLKIEINESLGDLFSPCCFCSQGQRLWSYSIQPCKGGPLREKLYIRRDGMSDFLQHTEGCCWGYIFSSLQSQPEKSPWSSLTRLDFYGSWFSYELGSLYLSYASLCSRLKPCSSSLNFSCALCLEIGLSTCFLRDDESNEQLVHSGPASRDNSFLLCIFWFR